MDTRNLILLFWRIPFGAEPQASSNTESKAIGGIKKDY